MPLRGRRRVRCECQAELGPGGSDCTSSGSVTAPLCLCAREQRAAAERRTAIVEPEPRLGRHHGSVSQAPGSGLPRRGHAAFPQDAVRSPAERDAADAAQVLLSLPALRLPGAGHELLATVLTWSVQEARSAVSQGGCPGGCWEFGMMFRRRSLGELASFFFHGSQSWLVFET